jgi:hypothetical protein
MRGGNVLNTRGPGVLKKRLFERQRYMLTRCSDHSRRVPCTTLGLVGGVPARGAGRGPHNGADADAVHRGILL